MCAVWEAVVMPQVNIGNVTPSCILNCDITSILLESGAPAVYITKDDETLGLFYIFATTTTAPEHRVRGLSLMPLVGAGGDLVVLVVFLMYPRYTTPNFARYI